MWPEIVACEPGGGWQRDKLLPPAAGSFSATEAPTNQFSAASRNCRSSLSLGEKGKNNLLYLSQE